MKVNFCINLDNDYSLVLDYRLDATRMQNRYLKWPSGEKCLHV